MAKKRAAYSLVELVVVVLFIGILAVVTVPRLQFGAISKYKAETTAKKIVTDLRYTRSLAISDAAENTTGFAVSMIGSNSYTGYEIVNFDTSTTITNGTFSFGSTITCTGGSQFRFGPLGNLLSGSDTQLTVSAGGKTIVITITPATGMIKCTEN